MALDALGVPYKHIAERYGLTISGVSVAVSRARQRGIVPADPATIQPPLPVMAAVNRSVVHVPLAAAIATESHFDESGCLVRYEYGCKPRYHRLAGRVEPRIIKFRGGVSALHTTSAEALRMLEDYTGRNFSQEDDDDRQD